MSIYIRNQKFLILILVSLWYKNVYHIQFHFYWLERKYMGWEEKLYYLTNNKSEH